MPKDVDSEVIHFSAVIIFHTKLDSFVKEGRIWSITRRQRLEIWVFEDAAISFVTVATLSYVAV